MEDNSKVVVFFFTPIGLVINGDEVRFGVDRQRGWNEESAAKGQRLTRFAL